MVWDVITLPYIHNVNGLDVSPFHDVYAIKNNAIFCLISAHVLIFLFCYSKIHYQACPIHSAASTHKPYRPVLLHYVDCRSLLPGHVLYVLNVSVKGTN